MTTDKTKKTTKGPEKTEEPDKWADAREVLIVAGTAVREGLEKGESWEGIYLGHVERQSTFGHVNMHLMQTADGLSGMWGHHALDEGLGRASVGVETRVDGRGMLELDGGKTMRLVRVRQLGTTVPNAPIIRDARAEADAVYEALGLDPAEDVVIDPETGEVMESRS